MKKVTFHDGSLNNGLLENYNVSKTWIITFQGLLQCPLAAALILDYGAGLGMDTNFY